VRTDPEPPLARLPRGRIVSADSFSRTHFPRRNPLADERASDPAGASRGPAPAPGRGGQPLAPAPRRILPGVPRRISGPDLLLRRDRLEAAPRSRHGGRDSVGHLAD